LTAIAIAAAQQQRRSSGAAAAERQQQSHAHTNAHGIHARIHTQ